MSQMARRQEEKVEIVWAESTAFLLPPLQSTTFNKSKGRQRN